MNEISKFIEDNALTFCGLSFELDAMLADEATYYMGSYDDILQNAANKGNEIMAALSQQTNATMITPLAYQF